jgi:hypothetical protein
MQADDVAFRIDDQRDVAILPDRLFPVSIWPPDLRAFSASTAQSAQLK